MISDCFGHACFQSGHPKVGIVNERDHFSLVEGNAIRRVESGITRVCFGKTLGEGLHLLTRWALCSPLLIVIS
jgi:hypothetical protein